MSRAQIEKFMDVILKDSATVEQACGDARDPHMFFANLVQDAKRRGCDFTEDELREWWAQSGRGSAGGELSERQLDAVAGGVTSPSDEAQRLIRETYNRAARNGRVV